MLDTLFVLHVFNMSNDNEVKLKPFLTSHNVATLVLQCGELKLLHMVSCKERSFLLCNIRFSLFHK